MGRVFTTAPLNQRPTKGHYSERPQRGGWTVVLTLATPEAVSALVGFGRAGNSMIRRFRAEHCIEPNFGSRSDFRGPMGAMLEFAS